MTRIVDHATARRASIVAAIWIPLAIVVIAEAIVIAVGARHGGALITGWRDGHVEYGPWWFYAVLVAAIGIPVIGLVGLFILRATRMSGMNAWMPAILVAITVFHTIGMGVGVVVLNASPLTPAVPLAGGAVLGAAAGWATWRLVPREAPSDSALQPGPPIEVAPGTVAAWTGRAEVPRWFVVTIGGIAAALIAIGVALVLVHGWRIWPIFLAATLMLVALVTATDFHVTAGARGLVARSVIGWPVFRIPAADIATAGMVQIDPMADFGGWGLRWVLGPNRKGRFGIITHRGPALEVVRRDGRSMVVTVDDAATAAAVLTNYAKP